MMPQPDPTTVGHLSDIESICYMQVVKALQLGNGK